MRDKELCNPQFMLNNCVTNSIEKKIVARMHMKQKTKSNQREEIIVKPPYIGNITKRLVKNSTNRIRHRTQRNSSYSFQRRKENNYFK